MRRSGVWPLLARVIGVIAVLLLLGILLKLIGAMLTPLLPPILLHDLGVGGHLLYSVASPALPAVMAVVILGALIWIIIGRR